MRNFKNDWILILRGLKMIHSLQPYTILAAVCRGLFISIYPFIGIYFSSLIITELKNPNKSIKRVITMVILTIVCSFVCQLLMSLLSQLFDMLQYMLGHKKELDLVGKTYNLDYADLEDTKIQELREKLQRGRYSKGIIGIVFQINVLVQHAFSIIISMILIFQMFSSRSAGCGRLDHVINSPFVAITVCIILIGSILYTTKTNSISQKKNFELINQTSCHYKYEKFYSHNISLEYNSGKDIRLYNQKNLIQQEVAYHLNQIFNFEKIIPNMNAKDWTISSCLQVVANIIIYLFVGVKALVGAVGIGNIVLYTGAITQFSQGVSGVVQTLSTIKENGTYLSWYFNFIDLPNRKQSGSKLIDREAIKDATIEFKNVSFKYPGNENYSLENISVIFDAKKRVAVVGKNGSGKTTFIKLLCRLYDPTEGEILLNGINIKEYDYNSYLSVFSVVFQDFKLFSCSLGENIASSACYDEKLVKECIVRAGLKLRMEKFPDGLATQFYNEFSEEGVEISGGEAQKVAIARALYKDSPFIVLDEPTAALDPVAEADIYTRLNDLIQDKTAIYISHRLSSCCFCNQVVVFDQGKIVQSGKHEDLLSDQKNIYYELWNAQAQYYV